MADLLGLKQRLHNIKSVYEITDAMQVITTIIIGRAQKLFLYRQSLQPDYDRIYKVVSPHEAIKTPADEWLMMFFSERGFCGSYNQLLLPQLAKNKQTPNIIVVGLKGKEFVERLGIRNYHYFSGAAKLPTLDNVKELLTFLEAKGFPRNIKVVHNVYHNMFSQTPKLTAFYPEGKASPGKMKIELSEEDLALNTMRSFTQGRILGLLSETYAGEIASKLFMMRNAVENAEELRDALAREVFKVRQMNITQELSEVISAYKVLQTRRERKL